MAHLIDVRNSGGSLVVLGDSLVLPAGPRPTAPVPGALRRDVTTGVVEIYTGPTGGPYDWQDAFSSGGALTITGDASGSGTGSIALTLATTGVTPGTYTQVVVDAKGRVTSGSVGGGGSITLAGDVTGSGTGTVSTTLSSTGVTPGTYTQVVVDTKGRVIDATSVTFLTSNQTITVSGDASGSGSTAIPLTLASTGVTPGTYTQVVVDAKGRVTSGSSAPVAAIPVSFTVACSDETTAITTGAAKVTFRMAFGMNLTAVRASLTTASSSGVVDVDVDRAGISIFSTRLTINALARTSTTATVPSVLSTTVLNDDDEITIDVVAAGTGATGLKVTFIGTRL